MAIRGAAAKITDASREGAKNCARTARSASATLATLWVAQLKPGDCSPGRQQNKPGNPLRVAQSNKQRENRADKKIKL
jgi:hypothetical protein